MHTGETTLFATGYYEDRVSFRRRRRRCLRKNPSLSTAGRSIRCWRSRCSPRCRALTPDDPAGLDATALFVQAVSGWRAERVHSWRTDISRWQKRPQETCASLIAISSRSRLVFRPVTLLNLSLRDEVKSTDWSQVHHRVDVVAQPGRVHARRTRIIRRSSLNCTGASLPSGARVDLRAGAPAFLYWPGLVIFAGLMLATACLAFRAIEAGEWQATAFIAGDARLFPLADRRVFSPQQAAEPTRQTGLPGPGHCRRLKLFLARHARPARNISRSARHAQRWSRENKSSARGDVTPSRSDRRPAARLLPALRDRCRPGVRRCVSRVVSSPLSCASLATDSSAVWRCWVSKSAGTYSASITGVIGKTLTIRTMPPDWSAQFHGGIDRGLGEVRFGQIDRHEYFFVHYEPP